MEQAMGTTGDKQDWKPKCDALREAIETLLAAKNISRRTAILEFFEQYPSTHEIDLTEEQFYERVKKYFSPDRNTKKIYNELKSFLHHTKGQGQVVLRGIHDGDFSWLTKISEDLDEKAQLDFPE